MGKLTSGFVLGAFAVLGLAAAPVSPALEQMAGAERAFAKMALEKGIRDAFVAFFADDSIGFYPTPMNAREFYRGQPPSPLTTQLVWEPRTGDVAASGELGWLTGPFSVRDTTGTRPPGYGCYFSLWRKQADGSWKVLMDVGVNTPGEVTSFAPGFVAVPEPAGRSKDTSATFDAVLAADKALSAAVADKGASAYGPVLTAASRLHVPRQQPMVGAEAIASWVSASGKTVFTPETGEVARSGELGFTRGAYERTGADGAVEKGYYVRTWKRVGDGRWTLGVEVRNPLPPARPA